MAKEDQWFKFFYKQFIISTQGWKDDEVGAYVKLLINQFESGRLPDDPIELGKLITTYKKNWPLLSKKFKRGEDGFLRNDFMNDIRKERDEKSKKNSELGKLGGRPKNKRTETESKPNGFKNESHIYSSSLSDSGFENKGVGKETFVVPKMLDDFKQKNKSYPIDLDADFTALRSISDKIISSEDLTGWPNDHTEFVLKRWSAIVDFVKTDAHLSKYSLSQIDKYFQSVIQSLNSNGTHQQSTKKSSVRKDDGAIELTASLKDDIASLTRSGS